MEPSPNQDLVALMKELRERIYNALSNAYGLYVAGPDAPIGLDPADYKYNMRISPVRQRKPKIELKNLNKLSSKDVIIDIHSTREWRRKLGVEVNPANTLEVNLEGMPAGMKAWVPANGKENGTKVTLIEVETGVKCSALFGEGAEENKNKLIEAVRWFYEFLDKRGVFKGMPAVSGTESQRKGASSGNEGPDSYSVVGEKCQELTGRWNRIIFGAPGTGKSYKINGEACRHEDKDDDKNNEPGIFESADGKDCRYERVTFYPTYSYAQFVGTYKPVMRPVTKSAENGAESEENKVAKSGEEIAYEFVPGPFLRVLANALKAPVINGKKLGWCLIIEEINRANAAAVFGDVFQLLDRNSKGVSEYSVAASEDVKRYLKNELKGQQDALQFLNVGNDGENDDDWKSCSLRIPDNMYIWATMNSADQGVFPMDTAFKRRWEFEYVGINDGEREGKASEWTIGEANSNPDPKWNWNANRKLINRLLTLCGVNEDKLMGPFFVRATNDFVSAAQFESKVLMYLWEDAARMCRSKLFPNVKTYSELVKLWKDNGPKIFEEVMKNGTPFGDDKEAKGCWNGLWTKATDEMDTAGQGAHEANVETA